MQSPVFVTILFSSFLLNGMWVDNERRDWNGLSFGGDRPPVALRNSFDFEYPNSGDWGWSSQKASDFARGLNTLGFRFEFVGADRTLVSVFRHPVEREIIPVSDPADGNLGTFFSHLQQLCDAYELRFEVVGETNIYLYPLFPLRVELEETYGRKMR